jgi:hypothetical protein
LVICGEELVSFEVGNEVKVIAVKLDPQSLKRTITRLKDFEIENLLVTSAIDDMINKDMKSILQSICNKNLTIVDSIDFTTI